MKIEVNQGNMWTIDPLGIWHFPSMVEGRRVVLTYCLGNKEVPCPFFKDAAYSPAESVLTIVTEGDDGMPMCRSFACDGVWAALGVFTS